jgi:hypothetical protein
MMLVAYHAKMVTSVYQHGKGYEPADARSCRKVTSRVQQAPSWLQRTCVISPSLQLDAWLNGA